jgi:hypothetical protein
VHQGHTREPGRFLHPSPPAGLQRPRSPDRVQSRRRAVRASGLSGSTGEIHGVIPSSSGDNAFTARTGDPEPMELQGIRHGLETSFIGHMKGALEHWSSEEEHDETSLPM